MVSIILDWWASSSKTRRSSEIERLSTSSETNVFGQTVCNSSSLGMASPARLERHTSTSITFGSKRVDVPFWEMVLRLGWISQGPTRKPWFTTPSSKPKERHYIPDRGAPRPTLPPWPRRNFTAISLLPHDFGCKQEVEIEP